jgi:hypothetical protein
MNDTFLTLQGWIPMRFELKGDVGFFLYNQSRSLVVNKTRILENEVLSVDDFKISTLTIVQFSDMPGSIIDRVLQYHDQL